MFNKLTHLSNQNIYQVKRIQQHIHLIPKDHKSTLIALHGLGDSADGYLDMFNDPSFPVKVCPPSMKVILLTAPNRPFTEFDGQKMNSWFDMKRSDWMDQEITVQNANQFIGLEEAEESRQFVTSVLEQEKQLVGEKNVYIFGFSQGCAMALHVGLSLKYSIGGILGFSGFVFPFTPLTQESLDTNILLSHGTYDDVITLNFAMKTYKSLEAHKVQKEIIQGLEHSFDIQSYEQMKQFLSKEILS